MEGLSQQRDGSMRWYLLCTLIAVELLMSFSFLGYMHIEPISITIAYIPVLLAGVLLGPVDSMVLGAVFGLASMWKASANYVMPQDQLFSPFSSGHPIESLLLSVGSRMLFGLLIGLFYQAARKARHTGLWIALVSFLGRHLHSLLVYSAMGLLFPKVGYGPLNAFRDFWSANGIVTNLVTMVIIQLIWCVTRTQSWQQFKFRVEMARSVQLRESYHRLSLIVIILLTLCSAVAVAIYFVNRMNYVLNQKGIILADADYSDLIHLQIQFLIGILSMMTLVIMFLIFNRRYSTYMNYEAKIDNLTGVMTRKTFFQSCGNVLNKIYPRDNATGYFIMLDLDYFKLINDNYGHPEGDRALKETAQALKEIFGQDGLIGRVGGDEFAVMLYTPITKEELEVYLRHFLDRVHKIVWDDGFRVSCSMGALPIAADKTVEELYSDADRLLYTAKEQGRDRFVISIHNTLVQGEVPV